MHRIKAKLDKCFDPLGARAWLGLKTIYRRQLLSGYKHMSLSYINLLTVLCLIVNYNRFVVLIFNFDSYLISEAEFKEFVTIDNLV